MTADNEESQGSSVRKKPRVPRGLLQFIISNIGAQGLSFAAALILGRLVTTPSFGRYGIFLAVTSIGSALLLSRLDTAVALSKGAAETERNTVTSIAFVVVVGGVLVPLPVCAAILSNLFSVSFIDAFAAYVTIVGASIYQILLMLAANCQRTAVYSVGRILNILAIISIQVASIFLFGDSTLAFGHSVGQAVSTVIMFVLLWPTLKIFRRSYSAVEIFESFKKLSPYLLWGGAAAGVNILAQREVLVLVVASLYGGAAAGLIAFSLRTTNGALGAISIALAHFIAPQVGPAVHRGEIKNLFWDYAPWIVVTGALIMVPFLLFSKELYGLVFGAQWSDAGSYVRALSPIFICQFVISPFSTAMFARNQHIAILIWDLGRIVVVGALAWFAHLEHVSVFPFLLAVSVSYSCFYLWLLWQSLRSE